MDGSASTFDAYVDQTGWPAGFPDGAVPPWALAVWKEIGPGTRFRTFGPHTYCMVPRCKPERGKQFTTSPRLLNVFFGPATEAKAILHEEGLDHFLVEMDADLNDLLMCSALFSADEIHEHLGIRWTD